MDRLSPQAEQGTSSGEKEIINPKVETTRIRQIKRVIADICVDSCRRHTFAIPGGIFLSVINGLQSDSADVTHAPPEIFP